MIEFPIPVCYLQIVALHGNVKKVEYAQKQLDTNLEVIFRQQEELHQLVTVNACLMLSVFFVETFSFAA